MLRIGKDKSLDLERSLLSHANEARFSKSEEEIISNYRSIINRKNYSQKTRRDALLSLANYIYNDRGKKENAIRILEDYQVDFKNSSVYTKVLATFYWSLNSASHRFKAVSVLLEYFASLSKNPDPPNLNDRLELLGQLLTYRGIFQISQREDLKARRWQISNDEYMVTYEEQKRNFIDICNQQGTQLFKMIQDNDFDEFSTAAKQNALTGLLQYVDVLSRVNRNPDAISVCRYVLDRITHPYTNEFQRKIRKVQSFSGMG